MTERPQFVDNRDDNTLTAAINSYLSGLGAELRDSPDLDVVTGYFNPRGYFSIADGLEHVDLAGDVEVVRLGLDAGIRHRVGRLGERASTVKHRVDLLQHFPKSSSLGQLHRPMGKPQFLRHWTEGIWGSTRQNRPVALLDGPMRNKTAGVPIRPVEKIRHDVNAFGLRKTKRRGVLPSECTEQKHKKAQGGKEDRQSTP